jgi:hypothetical protein
MIGDLKNVDTRVEESWAIGRMGLPDAFAVTLPQFIIATIVLVAVFQVVGYLLSNWV